jgi:hypothetical protein
MYPGLNASLSRALYYSTATKLDGSTVSGRTLGTSFVAIFIFCRERYSPFVAKDLYLLFNLHLLPSIFCPNLMDRQSGKNFGYILSQKIFIFCHNLHLLSQKSYIFCRNLVDRLSQEEHLLSQKIYFFCSSKV